METKIVEGFGDDDLFAILDAIAPQEKQPGDMSKEDIMNHYDVLEHTAEKMMKQAAATGEAKRIMVKLPSGQMGWVLRKVV